MIELDRSWVLGFVDGEGCFSVSITKCFSMAIKYQVLPEFVVVQHKRDLEFLEAFVAFFKCGKVCPNHGDRKCYRVRALSDLRDIIVPFFKANVLQTRKREDFEQFCKIIDIMDSGEHKTIDGLEKIKAITYKMNNRKKRLLKQKKTVIVESEVFSSIVDDSDIDIENEIE